MANIKSQKKRILTNAKAAERNKAVRSELKSRMKAAESTIGEEANDDAVARRDQEDRHGCPEGCHPQERRSPQEEPPHEEGQRRRLTRRTT